MVQFEQANIFFYLANSTKIAHHDIPHSTYLVPVDGKIANINVQIY